MANAAVRDMSRVPDYLLSTIQSESTPHTVMLSRPKEPFWVAVGVFVAYIAVGAVITFHYHVFQGDAVSRVMSGFYIIFQQIHFAAVGFVWNPLPSLLALPLLVFHNVWPPLLTWGFAGIIVSSAFGAVGGYYLNRILQHFGIPQLARIVWVALYVLCPEILLEGSTGMTDTSMLACFLASLDGLLWFVDTEQLSQLVWSGVWLGICFLVRYESVPFALCIGTAWGFAMWVKKVPWRTIWGREAVLALPITYLGVLWVFFNATIMHDPLYFLNGPYSNSTQIKTGAYNWWATKISEHNILGGLHVEYVFTRLFVPFLPALALVVVVALLRRLDMKALILIGAAVAVPLLQLGLMYDHDTAAWSRFFMSFIAMGFVLVAYLLGLLMPYLRRHWTAVVASCLVVTAVFAWGDARNLAAISNPRTGHGIYPTPNAILNSWGVHRLAGVDASVGFGFQNSLLLPQTEARYINDHPHWKVLLDTFGYYGVFPFIKNPNQVIATFDVNFQSVLHNPRGRVNIIFDAPPTQIGNLNAIDTAYPTMYSGALPWTKLVKTFPGGTKVYEVLANAP
jgi:hypothetical protein